MTTHTLTRTNKWNTIAMFSIAAFVVGLMGRMIFGVVDANWVGTFEALFFLAAIAGMIMSFVSAPRVFGGLKVGLTGLITGVVFFIIGNGMLNSVEVDVILGVEFPDFSSPLYVIGWPLNTFGILLMIIGGIMAIVTYLRRVLKAVEGNKVHAGS